jgi:very-short-patch-repair endonuclease
MKQLCNSSNYKLCSNNDCERCYNKSFASHEKTLYWNYEKNNNINPRNVFKNTHTKYYFNCDNCKHIFNIALKHINNKQKVWCSYCSNPPKKLCNDNNCNICYEKSFASHKKAKYWDYDKNNNINPRTIFKNENKKKYYFNCKNCKHTFNISLIAINKNKSWCPFCSNPPKKLCNDNDCKNCYEKSFASHEKALYWNYEKNNNISPREVFKNTHNKYFFDCIKCNHYFDINLANINNIYNLSWCPYCANKKLCNNNNCKLCFDNSFASHKMIKYWNYEKNININPRNIFKNTNINIYFKCNKCKHDFNANLHSLNNKINNCSYCSKTQSKLCDNNDCQLCYEKSFASHEKAKYWNYEKNNNINPRNIFKNAHKKYYFDCNNCKNSFKLSLMHISSQNIWCSICKNKTEKIIYDFLLLNNFIIEKEAKFEWSINKKTNKYFRYDFYIEKFKLIIEIDGKQHFTYIKHWKNDYKANQERDKYKMDIALKEGYSIIRMLQNDIYKNKFDWKKELLENIKINIEPRIIYICKKNEYFEYIN